jgi:hypothetical protein
MLLLRELLISLFLSGFASEREREKRKTASGEAGFLLARADKSPQSKAASLF